MGIYINPTNGQTKEQWLTEHCNYFGSHHYPLEKYDEIRHSGSVPVCLVDNGLFTAAAVAFDKREVMEFSRPTDFRPATWYVIPIKSLMDHAGIAPKILEPHGLLQE